MSYWINDPGWVENELENKQTEIRRYAQHEDRDMLRMPGIPLLENKNRFLASWFDAFTTYVLLFYGVIVLWFYGSMVLWFYCLMALWFYGWFYCFFLWFHGFTVV